MTSKRMGGAYLMTCGSSSSSTCPKTGGLENDDGCGRGAKGEGAPKDGLLMGGDIAL